MTQIDYFLSTISPFTYLAGNRLEEVAEKHGAKVVYKPFDVVATFARTGGTPPSERHPSRKAYRLQEMERVSKHVGMPINLQPLHWPTNSAPSAYAIIAAQNATGGSVGHLAQLILAACWTGQKDVAAEDTIRACLEKAGFDPDLANTGLMEGAEVFAANNEEAVARGVFGAPTYLVDDQVFWGQDRLSYLDAYLAGDG